VVTPKAIVLAADALNAYLGTYELKPKFDLVITREGNHLAAQATGQPKLSLLAESPTLFFSTDVDAKVEFVRDEKGTVTGLILHQGGRDLRGSRK
jgi:hypothetical protein